VFGYDEQFAIPDLADDAAAIENEDRSSVNPVEVKPFWKRDYHKLLKSTYQEKTTPPRSVSLTLWQPFESYSSSMAAIFLTRRR